MIPKKGIDLLCTAKLQPEIFLCASRGFFEFASTWRVYLLKWDTLTIEIQGEEGDRDEIE